MAKKKKSNKKRWEFTGLLILILIAVFALLLFLLLRVYRDYVRIEQDLYNVKETVDLQSGKDVKAVFEEVKVLKQELADQVEKQDQVPENLYVNKSHGLSFIVPRSSDHQSVIQEDGNIVHFGPMITSDQQPPEPQYQLRVFPDNTFDDYKQNFIFKGQECEPDMACITLDSDFSEVGENRDQALDMLITPRNLPKL